MKNKKMILINYTENKHKTGIYCIRNLVNGKIYIGSTKRGFETRKNRHILNLRKGTHYNEHLKNAFTYYKEQNFSFEILLICSPDDCDKHEADFIRLYSSNVRDKGYNIQSVVNYKFNYKLSETHCKENGNRKKEKGKIINGFQSDERGLPKPFKQYDINGNFICEYNSAAEYVEKNGSTRAHVSKILTKRKLYFYDTIILFSNDILTIDDIEIAKKIANNRKKREINIFDLDDNYILTKECTTEAAKYIKSNVTAVRQCCIGKRNRIGKFKTKYKKDERT